MPEIDTSTRQRLANLAATCPEVFGPEDEFDIDDIAMVRWLAEKKMTPTVDVFGDKYGVELKGSVEYATDGPFKGTLTDALISAVEAVLTSKEKQDG